MPHRRAGCHAIKRVPRRSFEARLGLLTEIWPSINGNARAQFLRWPKNQSREKRKPGLTPGFLQIGRLGNFQISGGGLAAPIDDVIANALTFGEI